MNQKKQSATVTQEPELARQLPNNLDAERSVLGAILLENKTLTDVRDLLEPGDFFLDQHRRIFIEMLTLAAMEQPIDILMVTDELTRKQALEAAGGAAYISALVDTMPRVSNIVHYAQIVREASLLRKLLHSMHAIEDKAFEREASKDVLAGLRTTLTQLEDLQPQRGPVLIKTVVQENLGAINAFFEEGRKVTGVPTGYSELDKLTSGLQPAELIVLAARPSIGKSSLALNIAENICVRNEARLSVLFFSLEMNSQSLLTRLSCSIANVDSHKYRTGLLNAEDKRRMKEANVSLMDVPLWIDDASNATVAQLAARAERIKRDNGLSLVIVDYLQLVSGSTGKRFNGRQEEVGDVSRGLKSMAKGLGIPVLACAQLRRGQDREERTPMLSDLRESGAIEQDADVVMFIHKPNYYKSEATQVEREQTELHVAKQRNGPTDMVKFVFRSRLTRFDEAAPTIFDGDYPRGGSDK